MIKKIISLFHIHWFNKPIVSQYRTFHTRNIVFECRCGKRKCEQVYRAFGDPFPIETSFVTTKEIDALLKESA